MPVKAPFFQGAKLLIAADCTAYAYANFYQEFMRDKVTIVGCPKLDPVEDRSGQVELPSPRQRPLPLTGQRNGCRRRSAPDSPGKTEKPKLEIDNNSKRGFERLDPRGDLGIGLVGFVRVV